ncbi:hypothetical protein [Cryobacterium tagatosivorans]|uniref:Uncharacterized protein n=1 Tax=Cryobacterium tagatosivorans TaxID=1259199 RepID=A0A4R8UF84_9MICO|nr:hypothetical protein [Cryobacterium tagatosivorans]TFB52556.1 hypothetical protein E3O23_06055 [Cryobacterium tagatosivorans]
MTIGDGESRRSLRRAIIAVSVIAALLLGALLAAIGSLNREVYSAGGFVRQYLEALARHDPASALAMPGVELTNARLTEAGLPRDVPSTLLRGSVLGELSDIELRSDTAGDNGRHTVVYDFQLDGRKSTMEFAVARTGAFAGVFDSWRFTTSPLAVLQVTVLHEATFTVNGLTLDTRAHAAAEAPVTFSNQAAYLAFAPALYDFTHDSTLLTAAKQAIPVTSATAATDVTIDAMPNRRFIKQVQTELNDFLTACATQKVLQPSNCPFGIEINDQVQGLPAWSIASFPVVALAAGQTTFEMPPTVGQAHIVVDVRSLFDGELTTRDEDVPFTVALSVTIKPDGALAIQLH